MLLEDRISINLSVAEVSPCLVGSIGTMEEMASASYRHGEELYGSLGLARSVAKTVVIGIGRPRLGGGGVTLPVTWVATGGQSLFARLDGDLRLVPQDARSCVLSVQATCKPPLGWGGSGIDRALLARISGHTMRDWLVRMASWVEAVLTFPNVWVP